MPQTTNDFLIFIACLALTSSGAIVGHLFARSLPDHHLTPEARQTVSVSIAVVGTLSALVLGLLLSSANRSFSDRQDSVVKLATQMIQSYDLLTRFGPEANEARSRLRTWGESKHRQLFPAAGGQVPGDAEVYVLLEQAQEALLALKPRDDRQRWLQSQALQISSAIVETRWLLEERPEGNIPDLFVYLVVFWLTLVFTSFGLCSPTNGTALTIVVLCSFAVSSGIMMILELDTPLTGVLHISDRAMWDALAHMAR